MVMSSPRVRRVVLVGLLSALTISIVLSGVSKYLSFPILTYLKFDPAEIPSFIGLLVGGVQVGVYVAIFHYLFLLWFGEFTPIGPTMKFLAVLSTIIGWSLGGRISNNLAVKLASASILRVVVMTIANIYVLTLIFPEWIGYAGRLLGMEASSSWEVLMVVLGLTGVYNVLHVVFVNYLVSKIIVDRLRYFMESTGKSSL